MAIFVEQEKNRINFFGFLVVIISAAGFLLLVYYLFFAPVPLADVVMRPDLQIIAEVAEVELDISAVIDSPVFQALEEHIPAPEVREPGRVNPFARF